jgi:ribonuclease Z
MKRLLSAVVYVGSIWLALDVVTAQAAPCLIVTLTGTHGGPQQPFNGLASAGTLVRYGDDANNCSTVILQFDAGRATTMRLSQLRVGTERLNAVFFTHMHTDHTDGFVDLVLSRWAFHGTGPKIDIACSFDVISPQGFTISCRNFTAHIADAFIQSGEIAQRHSEVKERSAGGPAELIHTITFDPKDERKLVWSFGGASVSAIRSTHIPGHVSYRVDTPAGSVVIGGDAVNDMLAPLGSTRLLIRWKGWPKAPTSSCIRPFIRSWDRGWAATCIRTPSIAKALPQISARWRSAMAQNTSCLRI